MLSTTIVVAVIGALLANAKPPIATSAAVLPTVVNPSFVPHDNRARRHHKSSLEIAPEVTGRGLPLSKCEAYNRVYDQPYGSS